MLTTLEKKVLASIQDDIPITPQPFKELANRIGIEEKEYLAILKNLCDRGVIRRFGATIRHQKSGYEANAMVAWQVDEDRIESVGKKMAGSRHVSHCYRRNPTSEWPYNLYTMIHASDEDTCKQIAQKLSEKTSVKTYLLLFSRMELKKTSMRYFPDIQ